MAFTIQDKRTALVGIAIAGACACVAMKLMRHRKRKRKRTIKLNYGNVPWWRAEISRIALHLGGVEFEDVRWQPYFGEEMTAAAKAAGNGHAPWIEVDGKFLFQTSAIARYCADLAGLTPAGNVISAHLHLTLTPTPSLHFHPIH